MDYLSCGHQSYDYTLEKVKMYTRVPLKDIEKIAKGMLTCTSLELADRSI